jgi:Na+/proline symporter
LKNLLWFVFNDLWLLFNMPIPTLITFFVYFILLLGIGFYFCRKSTSIEDYLLGGRGMGAWVTALSAQASDMSGWLLMGLPGAIYLAGISCPAFLKSASVTLQACCG